MAGYQYTVIIGNVGRDPELRYTQSGVAVCDFSVAVSRRWTDRNTNEQREKTTWFRVSAWRQLAETVNQYVRKGMQIMVAGEVDATAFIGQDGEARATLELTARTSSSWASAATAPRKAASTTRAATTTSQSTICRSKQKPAITQQGSSESQRGNRRFSLLFASANR